MSSHALRPPHARALTALLALLGPLVAQAAPTARGTAATPGSVLHRAWLAAALDRDSDAANRGYAAVVVDPAATPEQRAFALARLSDEAVDFGDEPLEIERVQALQRLLGSYPVGSEPGRTAATRAVRSALALPPGAARDAALEAARQQLLEVALDADGGRLRSHTATAVDIVAERRRLDIARLREEADAAQARGDRRAEREARQQLLAMFTDQAGSSGRALLRTRRVRTLELLADGELELVEGFWSRTPEPFRVSPQITAEDPGELDRRIDALERHASDGDTSNEERLALVRLIARLRSLRATGDDATVARTLSVLPLSFD
ncbi:MAG: hypothetical protein IPM29_10740 [Planctomycetes bacterium]|nr:hypothetical protein [Planctomycetota bacterium]